MAAGRTSRKKPVFVLGGIALCAALIALAAVHVASQWDWRELPGGGRARVFGVTCGTTHSISFPTRSWSAHYQKLLSQPLSWFAPCQLVLRERGGSGARSVAPSTVIWFQIDSMRLVPFDATLVTDDGQKYHTAGGNGPTTDGYAYTGMKFLVVSPEPMLHLEVAFDGKPMQFEIPNPAYSAYSAKPPILP